MAWSKPTLLILGTRGIPASHGGFETFAERLALFLQPRGWHVVVYCQHEVKTVSRRLYADVWQGIERVHIEVAYTGPKATLAFDWQCVRDAATRDGVCLVLGYNSGVFLPYLRAFGRKVITNMDGVEWRRPKWSRAVRAWFWVNEWIAAWASQRLVADHPRIADHLATRRPRRAIATIPYGGDSVLSAGEAPVRDLGLEPGRYLISIARIERDNNIHMIVQAFSRRRRGAKLVVLGDLDRSKPYDRAILNACSDEVLLPGSIYEAAKVKALRFHARAYVHGHTVGGTNPSLVEALWAGNAVIAHDNGYNRWTAGDAGLYFSDADACDALMTTLLADDLLVARARVAARRQAAALFEWASVLKAYESEFFALGAGSPVGLPLGRANRGPSL